MSYCIEECISFPETSVIIPTPAYKHYIVTDQYGISVTDTKFISLKVLADRDGHFGLLEHNTTNSGNMYEINLGGWWNSASCFRRMPSYSCLRYYSDPDGAILNPSDYVELWFSFDPPGRIRYGEIKDCSTFITWADYTDNNPFDISHIAVSTYSGITGTWIFETDCK